MKHKLLSILMLLALFIILPAPAKAEFAGQNSIYIIAGKNEQEHRISANYLDTNNKYLASAQRTAPANTKNVVKKEKRSVGESLMIILGVSCLIAGATCYFFYLQMKTARKQEVAKGYITQGGIEIHTREDYFSHSTTTRSKA